MLTKTSFFILFTIAIFFKYEASANKPQINSFRDFLYSSRIRRDVPEYTSCCVVPTCDESGQCFETLSCGYICHHGHHRTVNYGSTPGYKLKEFYSQNECHFGECKEYKFLCKHCPNPNTPEFSIYTVRSDCKKCYY